MLKKDKLEKVRLVAVETLGNSGDKSAVPEIVKQLKDRSSQLRGAAARALGRLGGRSAIPHLMKLLDDTAIYRQYTSNRRNWRRSSVQKETLKALQLLTKQKFSTAQQWKDWWKSKETVK